MTAVVHDFLRLVHGVEQTLVTENHRSNAEIVGFCRQAGYDGLTARSPGMRIRLSPDLPADRPDWWPSRGEAALPWLPHWGALLDPERPLACFVHPDGKSNQASRFEAETVAALALLLSRHMLEGLAGRIGPGGAPAPVGGAAWRDRLAGFWREGIGIVTPHRAQQALVVAELQKRFDPRLHDLIRAAVDTVERFQGQERDVMIASMAMGDPDAIGSEDAFLYSLNRFNVMVSRARAKFVALMSEELVDHLANDVAVLGQSRLLKLFAETEANRIPAALPWLGGGGERLAPGTLRWHDSGVRSLRMEGRHARTEASRRPEPPAAPPPIRPEPAPPPPARTGSALGDLFDGGFTI